MIQTVYSNSYEVLREVLLSNMRSLRFEGGEGPFGRSSAFETVPVVVPTLGVKTDLQRAIAEREGVCAGIDFLTLAKWFSIFAGEPRGSVTGGDTDWLIWSVLSEDGPGSFRSEPGHERIRDYLKGKDELGVFALAQRISRLFVVYATYRFDWTLLWTGRIKPDVLQKGELEKLSSHADYIWQRDLWRRLASMGGKWRASGFFSRFPEAVERLRHAPADAEVELSPGRRIRIPDELHVFAPFTVAPLMLPLLKAYEHSGRTVWLYLLNPCSEYWFELVPKSLFDWRRFAGGEGSAGHPLLEADGMSTRANIDRLWRFTASPDTGAELGEEGFRPQEDAEKGEERGIFPERSALKELSGRLQELRAETRTAAKAYYIEARDPALLRLVQDSILLLEPDIRRLPAFAQTGAGGILGLLEKGDDSLTFAAAPTPTRELEALADWLQKLFRENPDIRPSDVLVAAPDIASVAALVDKVFGSLPEGQRIAWRLAGLSSLDADPASRALIGLADLIAGRAPREDFIDWLSLPLVGERFSLTADDLVTAESWLSSAGYRFGLSPAHLLAIDAETFGKVQENTLSRAIERLALGAAFPDSEIRPVGDTVPAKGTETGSFTGAGEQPELLCALARIADCLERLRAEASEKAGAAYWQGWAAQAIDLLLPDENAGHDYGELRRALAELSDDMAAAGDPQVSFRLFMGALAGKLGTVRGGGSASNAVTFTSMEQLRSLPFKAVAIIGLNSDSAFPGTSRREEFDLTAAAPRRGDRDSRVNNRNVFLDALLSARRKLRISYVCGTGQGADAREPSIVVQELRDWLLGFAADRSERRRAAALLTEPITLNAFSKRNFTGAKPASHSPAMLEAVKEADRENYSRPVQPFADGEPHTEQGTVPFAEIMRWWRNPSAERLAAVGVRLYVPEESSDEGLMPEGAGLASWQRVTDAEEAALAGKAEDIEKNWLANPLMGAQGVREWAVRDDLALGRNMAAKVRELAEGLTPLRDRQIEYLIGNEFKITHTLTRLFDAGGGRVRLIRTTASKADSPAMIRPLAEYALAAAALGGTAEMTVVLRPGADAENRDEPAVALLAGLSQAQAAGLVETLARVWARRAGARLLNARRIRGETQISPEDAVVWRGRDTEDGLDGTKKFGDALSSLIKAFIEGGSTEEALALFEERARGLAQGETA
jgi:exodeoxyribonuclease V gamma subunit